MAFMNRPTPRGPMMFRVARLVFAASAQDITAPGKPLHVRKVMDVMSTAFSLDALVCT